MRGLDFTRVLGNHIEAFRETSPSGLLLVAGPCDGAATLRVSYIVISIFAAYACGRSMEGRRAARFPAFLTDAPSRRENKQSLVEPLGTDG